MPKLRVAAWVLAALTWAVAPPALSLARVAEGFFSGSVRDALGAPLPGVDIFLVPERRGLPALSSVSGLDGKFVIPGLPSGVYRIAGFKAGYLSFRGRVNTLLRSSFDVLLLAAPTADEAGGDAGPKDLTWALRLPRRSVFRDIDPADSPPEDTSGSARAGRLAPEDMIQGQVDQLFALGAVQGRGRESPVQGMQTRLLLESAIAGRGNIRLRGGRESLDATSAQGAGYSARRADVDMALFYDPTRDSSVHVKSYYTGSDLLAGEARSPEARRSGRAWGCEARWSKQLDPGARVDVGFHYLDTHGGTAGPLPAELGSKPASSRAVGALGGFESVTGGRHLVRLGFAAGFLEMSDPARPFLGAIPLPGADGPTGVHVKLNAQDAWSISARATLVSGLGFYRPDDQRGTGPSWIVPRAGAVWSGDRLRVRALVSYHGTLSTASGESQVFPPPHSPVGYEGEAEISLPLGIRVRASASDAPMESALLARTEASARPAPAPIYLAGGDTATREIAMGVERSSRSTSSYARFSRGSAEGMLTIAPLVGWAGRALVDQKMEYSTGRVGVRVAPSGTDLSAEYRRIKELRRQTIGPIVSEASFVELRVAQDILRLERTGTYWRFLLVARAAAGEPEGERDGERGDLASLGREVSAGVSVAF